VEGNKTVALYETLFVVHPEKGPRMKEFVERFKKVIEGQSGTLSQVDEWGLRDLAYRIEKQGKGLYTLLRFESSPRAVEELERNLKLTDGILRYLTVRVDPESVAPSPSVSKAPLEDQRKPTGAPGAEQATDLKTE
jgi:small subunit ribosomal protein S6